MSTDIPTETSETSQRLLDELRSVDPAQAPEIAESLADSLSRELATTEHTKDGSSGEMP